MTESWSRALSTLLDPRDPSVWLIDRVAVDFLMDINPAEPETVAALWAGKMADSLVKTIAQGADGERVLRFANRAEFLAWFLRDLARGTAWNRWYYRQFESLRSLPTGPAIREAMLREPDQAEAALLHLVSTNGIGTVTGFLSEADQERLVELCSPGETTPRKLLFEAVLRAWTAEPDRSQRPLYLFLKARTGRPEASAAEVRSAVRHVLTLARWQQSARLESIVAAVDAGRLTSVIERMSSLEQDTLLYLAFLVSEDPSLPARLIESGLIPGPRHAKEQTAPVDGGSGLPFATRWAGAFLLLPALIANRDLMRAYGGAEDGVLRYLLLAWCLRNNPANPQGYETLPDLDETLAIAAGLAEVPEQLKAEEATPHVELLLREQDLLPEDLEHLYTAGNNELPGFALEDSMRHQLRLAATVLLRDFARRLPGLGQSSPSYLWRNILSGDGFITTTPGQVLVELVARPLEIVLRLAGLNDTCFIPPWLAETEVIIRIDRQ
jgi:hypothetical protein